MLKGVAHQQVNGDTVILRYEHDLHVRSFDELRQKGSVSPKQMEEETEKMNCQLAFGTYLLLA
jgi:hypothetical protein